MMPSMTLAAAVLAGLLVAAMPALAADLKVGDKAPDFELKGSDGKTYKLSDFHGKKPVVLAWFPKAFTGGCTKQCTSYAKGSALLEPLNVAYFTASVDDAETNTKFAQSLDAKYPILADPTKKTAEAYGVLSPRGSAQRWTFYIDKEGVVRGIDKQIQTEKAAEETVEELKTLKLAD
jgi:peroxiredoxin Q/BCP